MSGKKTILIVEDDIHYGEILHDALTDFGYHTLLAYSATGGIDIIRQEKLDLVISDLIMPGINGIELAESVNKMSLDLPLVLLTGTNDLNLVKKALKAGVSDYIVKPININELPILIEKNLAKKNMTPPSIRSDKAHTLLKALKVLMRALDAKDRYTCGHSQRVAHLATLMGTELKFNDDALYHLQLGAYLHDIGKIGIPDSILKKADSLEEYEYKIARNHPMIGSKIIKEITDISDVISIVRHHHERFDGSGYPDGLKGDSIPLFARIIAIIDAYEALVSHRVYRNGTDEAEALAEIQQNAGKQFDPYLTTVFIRVMKRELQQPQEFNDQLLMAANF